MSEIKIETIKHAAEIEIADYLDNRLSEKEKALFEEHVAACGECLENTVSAYESVRGFRKNGAVKKGAINMMKKMNIYLVLAIVSFVLSFVMPRFFIQLLVITVLLGIKWIVDAKTTKMLVMIYDAWKKGGEKEAGRAIERLDVFTPPKPRT